jgi:simple sugar transport system permease protein
MSGGRGFLALAAVIFGGWRPLGVLLACMVFGGADALQLRLQAEASIPKEVWLAIAVVSVAFLAWTWIYRRWTMNWATVGISVAIAAGGVALFLVVPDIRLPSQLWLTLPYVLALLALAGLVGRVRMPSALAIPYRRGGAG